LKGHVILAVIRAAVLGTPFGPIRGVYEAFVMRQVRASGLFDRDYYLRANPDVAANGIDPLVHYVRYGDREGRQPVALFDPGFYRARARERNKRLNAVLHYLLVGRFEQVSPSMWFDSRYYLAQNRDVARSGMEPLRHFMLWGGLEGRSPSPEFDAAFYLRSNPRLQRERMNPLLHYLEYGRSQGLPVRAEAFAAADTGADVPTPMVPDEIEWSGVVPRADVPGALLDVVIPVYRGRAETLRCLLSVLRTEGGLPFEVVVINDASPEAELTSDLESLAARGLFRYLTNDCNQGFVATCNRAFRLPGERDVVLLNSDTEVYNDWLVRLRAAAYGGRDVATVTPLSNNATICSYPHFLVDNPYPLEIEFRELDRIAAETNPGITVEAPTGVGFCMYVTRASLDDVGLFDEALFGKGYGEENDFCQRAIQRGWRNIIAADVFVYHSGAASFQGERASRIAQAMEALRTRHPGYHKAVAAFIQDDPLAWSRASIDAARMARTRRAANYLLVLHNRGGGTERHVHEETSRLLAEGKGVFYLRPAGGQEDYVVVSSPKVKHTPNLKAIRISDVDTLHERCAALGISEVHTHSLVDFTPESPIFIAELVDRLQARWEINLHDYKVVCPRVNLADEDGYYCGEPAESDCDRCLKRRGNIFGERSIRRWRDLHGRIMSLADEIQVPDDDVAERLKRYFPGLQFRVVPHEPQIAGRRSRLVERKVPQGPLHVVVVGAIGKLKGYDVLMACANDARQRRLPMRFTVLGYTMNDVPLGSMGVDITGRYFDDEAVEKLLALEPDIVWLPSIWPETYSYTLSVALEAGCPVAAFDVGAISSRLRRLGETDYLMPLQFSRDARKVNEVLLQASEAAGAVEIGRHCKA
jgi:GT2 family glycosyltransferase/glycosyltransferase involved in cell wall biosynthesis